MATAVAQEGQPGPFPYMARTPMSNGVIYLTISSTRLPELRPLPWQGWPVAWTEWLIQTQSGNPTVAMQAPPGGEDDTAAAAAVCAAISASSSRALPCDAADAGGGDPARALPVSLVLRPPTDPRQLRQTGGPTVPERIRPPGSSVPAPSAGGRGGKGTRKAGKRSEPPKPAPKNASAPEERPGTDHLDYP